MRYLLFVLFSLLAFAGCTAIKPLAVPERTMVGTPHPFSHDDFTRVLYRFVNDQGRVDYTALKSDTRDLERYYLLLSTYSPDSHPDLFPTEQSKLAYWLNAYNAAVIKTVLTYYPIFGVGDIRPPLFFFLPQKSGFFLTWLQHKFPGRKATLLDYVALYVSAEKGGELQRAASYAVRFIPYDWRLNDQRGRA